MFKILNIYSILYKVWHLLICNKYMNFMGILLRMKLSRKDDWQNQLTTGPLLRVLMALILDKLVARIRLQKFQKYQLQIGIY